MNKYRIKIFIGSKGLNSIGIQYLEKEVNAFCSEYDIIDIKIDFNNEGIMIVIVYRGVD